MERREIPELSEKFKDQDDRKILKWLFRRSGGKV
jgi:hypothetical protein